jgi:hypothetical protein
MPAGGQTLPPERDNWPRCKPSELGGDHRNCVPPSGGKLHPLGRAWKRPLVDFVAAGLARERLHFDVVRTFRSANWIFEGDWIQSETL